MLGDRKHFSRDYKSPRIERLSHESIAARGENGRPSNGARIRFQQLRAFQPAKRAQANRNVTGLAHPGREQKMPAIGQEPGPARHTSPMPPLPNSATISQGPVRVGAAVDMEVRGERQTAAGVRAVSD